MPVCPNCQADNPEGARFCERCGHSLRRRPTWLVPAIGALAVVVLAGTAVAVLALRGKGPEEETAASGSSPTSAPSPSPSPTATGPVELEESLGRFLYGSRVNFWVVELSRDDECVVNGFRSQGIGRIRGAYKSDCSDWERAGLDIYFFRVVISNKSEQGITVERSDFSLRDRTGKVHRPIELGKQTLFPEEFVPKKDRIPAGSKLEGWLVFEGKGDYVPDGLSYRDGDEILTQTFDGKVTRYQPQ